MFHQTVDALLRLSAHGQTHGHSSPRQLRITEAGAIRMDLFFDWLHALGDFRTLQFAHGQTSKALYRRQPR
jgi:hypothetical protein